MSIPRTVADIVRQHVTLEVESLDRMYLNVYQPRLQTPKQVASFLIFHRGHPVASSVFLQPLTQEFVESIHTFVATHHVPLVEFAKGQRKDEVALEHLRKFSAPEGVVFVGKAQEKAKVCRTVTRIDPKTGKKRPWLVPSTAMVNHFYFYCVDKDFGPFFLKFCSYFPYNAKLCLNGHEYLKRQLAKEGIPFEALDNGIRSCAKPGRLQQICAHLREHNIDALLRKWLAKLPHPFTAQDRKAAYRYDLSILQMECALTQVFEQPRIGRIFFEEVIRNNLHLGRPDQVQLIFNRRVTKRTPGRFRTRVITDGVVPSLHIDYKSSRIKQYHKEGRALRTETTINNPYDFNLGKRLHNLSALRQVGFQANRRLLHVQTISHDCALGEVAFRQVNEPVVVAGQRASALRFADPAVQALLSVLVMFQLQLRGFSNRDLRTHWAPLLGKTPQSMTPGQMTYHLRRLRLHGLIERIPASNRYRVTDQGLRIALFCTRIYTGLFRPGLGDMLSPEIPEDSILRGAFDRWQQTIDHWIETQKIPA